MFDVRHWKFDVPLIFLLLLLVLLVRAHEQDYTFTTDNGTITITGYTGPGGDVAIPNEINGLPVTSIGAFAFASSTDLTSIAVPYSISSFGVGAFANCSSLAAITVADHNPFYSCVDGVLFDKSQTRLIQFPGGKVGSYTIPNGVTSIGDFAFYSFTNLTGITIPDGVSSIGNYAFWSTGLTNVTIPTSVTQIGHQAFACSSLSSVTIPATVLWVGYWAFFACPSLEAITVDALNGFYSSVDGVLFNKSQTGLIQFPAGRSGSYTIPNTVTSIWVGAFESCPRLTSIKIPASVTFIASDAFYHSPSLTGVYFQGDAPNLGALVFDGDNKVIVYYLPGSTGWGTTFGDRPTALWQPLIETSDGSVGVRTNQFGFNITWASGMGVVVEACTNLDNPIWAPVETNTLTGDSFYFSDPEWANYPARFYRLRSP